MKVQITFGAWPPVAVAQLESLGRLGMFITTGRHIPTALSVVAYLFLITGILSVVEIVFSATKGAIHPNFGFLGLFIFAGLRRYSRGWRTCALVFIWISIIVWLSAICIVVFDGPVLWQRPSDHKLVGIPLIWILPIVVGAFLVQFWQYRVLTRPEIRSLFYGESRTAA